MTGEINTILFLVLEISIIYLYTHHMLLTVKANPMTMEHVWFNHEINLEKTFKMN